MRAEQIGLPLGMPIRVCAWCDRPLSPDVRRDTLTCSKAHRQARARFLRAVGRTERAAGALRILYADPPYPGKAHMYREHPAYGGEVDHRSLVSRLQAWDGWALSTSAEAIPLVVALLAELSPPGWRVASWHRGARGGASAGPCSSWEPVFYRCARPIPCLDHPPDSFEYAPRARLTDPRRVIGAKPAAFWPWVFGLMGAAPGDNFVDLYPGSEGGDRAWRAWTGGELSHLEDGHTSRGAGGDVSRGARSHASRGTRATDGAAERPDLYRS